MNDHVCKLLEDLHNEEIAPHNSAMFTVLLTRLCLGRSWSLADLHYCG